MKTVADAWANFIASPPPGMTTEHMEQAKVTFYGGAAATLGLLLNSGIQTPVTDAVLLELLDFTAALDTAAVQH